MWLGRVTRERSVAEAVFAIPGDLRSSTGGYGYDRRVMELLPDFGVQVSALALPGSFPNPNAEDLAKTAKLIAGKPADAILVVDGLAFGAFSDELLAQLTGRVIALVHHPLFLE